MPTRTLRIGRLGTGWIQVNGEERRPTRKAREKFRVAREERNIPRRSREKDLMRRYCWAVGLKRLVKRMERMGGRTLLSMAKLTKTAGNICVH
jgi:hypothetical protein